MTTNDAKVRVSLIFDDSEIGRSLAAVGRTTEDVNEQIAKGMARAAQAAALASAAFTAFSVKAAVDFESAFAGVQKTVTGTEQQIAALSAGIRRLALEIPATTTEIAGVAEAAGQLGIKTDSILSFTRTMVDLGVATNLSSQEAATALARLANITGMSQGDFDRLGATIVELGNNMATTEREIVEMGLRLAGAGHQVGMTEAEILSFAAALSSVGIEAEAGGTAFSKVMVQMSLAAQRGGSELEDFARVAGMSAEAFAHKFKTDAAGAISAFIVGLGRIDESGGSALETLDNMGLGEIRLRDALLRATGASELFTRSLDIGTQAWEENAALTTEASRRYETTASQFQLLKNRATDFAITMGSVLLPAVNNVIDGLDRTIVVIGQLISWMSEHKEITAGVTASLVALGIVYGIVNGGIIATALSTGVMSAAMFIKAGAIALVNGALLVMNVLLGPIGLAILGVGLAVAGLVYVVTHWKEITDAVTGALMWLLEKLGITDEVMGILRGTVEVLSGAWEYITTKWNDATGATVRNAEETARNQVAQTQLAAAIDHTATHEIPRAIAAQRALEQQQAKLAAEANAVAEAEAAMARRVNETRDALAGQEKVTREKNETTAEFKERLAAAGLEEGVLRFKVDETVDSLQRQSDGTIRLFDKTGELVGAFREAEGIMVDVTDAIRAEEEALDSSTSATRRKTAAVDELKNGLDLLRASEKALQEAQTARGVENAVFEFGDTRSILLGSGNFQVSQRDGAQLGEKTLEQYAELVGMDLSIFRTLFQQQYGMYQATGSTRGAAGTSGGGGGDTSSGGGSTGGGQASPVPGDAIHSGSIGDRIVYRSAQNPDLWYLWREATRNLAQGNTYQKDQWFAGALPFAKGGIVTQPTLAILGDNPSRKEAVIPLERAHEMGFGGGGGGTSITLNVEQLIVQDGRDLDKTLRSWGIKKGMLG